MDLFDAISDIRKKFPTIDEEEIRFAMDAEIRDIEPKGRNGYREAVQDAHRRILDWLTNGHENRVDIHDPESITKMLTRNRQSCGRS